MEVWRPAAGATAASSRPPAMGMAPQMLDYYGSKRGLCVPRAAMSVACLLSPARERAASRAGASNSGSRAMLYHGLLGKVTIVHDRLLLSRNSDHPRPIRLSNDLVFSAISISDNSAVSIDHFRVPPQQRQLSCPKRQLSCPTTTQCRGTRNLALQHHQKWIGDSTLSPLGHVTWRYSTLGHIKLALLHIQIQTLPCCVARHTFYATATRHVSPQTTLCLCGQVVCPTVLKPRLTSSSQGHPLNSLLISLNTRTTSRPNSPDVKPNFRDVRPNFHDV